MDKYARRGHNVYSCFVDFAKFYNSTDHNLLFLQLAEKGISGNFHFLLKNMYMNCSYAIKYYINSNGNKVLKEIQIIPIVQVNLI